MKKNKNKNGRTFIGWPKSRGDCSPVHNIIVTCYRRDEAGRLTRAGHRPGDVITILLSRPSPRYERTGVDAIARRKLRADVDAYGRTFRHRVSSLYTFMHRQHYY